MSSSLVTAPPRPIESLVGTKLNDRWTLVELLARQEFQTGSCFSVGYKVEDNKGGIAYAKILDFSRALQDDDTALSLRRMTDAYVFELDLLKICAGLKLTRIIRGLDYGDFPCNGVPLSRLYFIVFEIAETGDLRKYVNTEGAGPLSWRFQLLRDITSGLRQLHVNGVLHQDLKPSNVLLTAPVTAKLGDLGRAYCKTLASPHDELPRPGAFHYAPPEQLYWNPDQMGLDRRQAGDLYLLGSMLDYFITGAPTTLRLIDALQDVHRPFPLDANGWRGYFLDVLPYLKVAHSFITKAFDTKCREILDASGCSEKLSEPITLLFKYATNPRPRIARSSSQPEND